MNSTLVVAGVGTLMLLAACGSADPATDTSIPPVAETDVINYAEGAFIPNGSRTGDAGEPSGTDVASDVPPSTDDAAGAVDATATTIGDVTSTTVPADGSATTVAPSGSAPQLGASEGLVRIGAVDYPFTTETCDVDDLGFSVLGFGASSSGQPVEIDIVAETVDLDGDSTVDISFDMFVVPNVAAGVDVSNLPDFYASKVKTSSFSEGDDIVVTVSGTRVSGSGPIEDFNGVAAPDGQTLPMTFDVQCA